MKAGTIKAIVNTLNDMEHHLLCHNNKYDGYKYKDIICGIDEPLPLREGLEIIIGE